MNNRIVGWVLRATLVALLGTCLALGCNSATDTTPGGNGAGTSQGGNTATGGATTSGSGGFGGIAPVVITKLVITPLEQIIEVDLNATSAQAYVATASYSDGSSEDVSATAVWSSDNAAAGTFNGATLEIPAFTQTAVEVTKISASFDGQTAVAQLTVVAYRITGPQKDFFFILPFEDPAGDQDKPLEFSTDVPALDVFFAMDTTGSMGNIITGLQGSVNTVITDIQAKLANAQFGVGAYEDFPLSGYGESFCSYGALTEADQPFQLFQGITSDAAAVKAGVDSLAINGVPIGCGNDWPESLTEALYQVATGEGLTGPAPTNVAANNSGVGGVAFRAQSMPVIVPLSDAKTQNGQGGATYSGSVGAAAHSWAQAMTAIDNICGRVVGVAANGYQGFDADPDFIAAAEATGAVVPPIAWGDTNRPAGCAITQCCTGQGGVGRAPNGSGLCPLAFRVNNAGTGLGGTIVTGLDMLTRFAAFDVVTNTIGVAMGENGETLPPGTSSADFIKTIVPVSAIKPATPAGLPDPVVDVPNGSFHDVTPGTLVSFQITAYNWFVEQKMTAQLFKATIQVLAGGCTALDERTVLILVPPAPIGPPA